MRTARFFVPLEWIALSAQAFSIPAGPIHRQMVSVLRMKVGQSLSLCANDGFEIDAVITEITKSAISGSIIERRAGSPLRPDIIVCAAVTKRDTFEWTLQKCTELGASGFLPLITDRVIKKTKDIPLRWLDIVREASEQSGRTTLPVIHAPMSLKDAHDYTKKYDRVVLHESVGNISSIPVIRPMDHVALFVGPEGGFTEHEIALLSSGKSTVVQLGDFVLRAETAATVGTALLRLSSRG
jgi:16S rRNA (uracil1498-N3)-methyltransferase